MLTEKLVDCLRPFFEAKSRGGAGDEETAAWETRMCREADDLKLESFRRRAVGRHRYCVRHEGDQFFEKQKVFGDVS